MLSHRRAGGLEGGNEKQSHGLRLHHHLDSDGNPSRANVSRALSGRVMGNSPWTAIARQLGSLTKKREVKRGGVRFIAYQIPLPQFR